MKEQYLSSRNTKKMNSELIGNVKIKKFKYIPKDSALLVLDMQKYFLEDTSHAFVPDAETVIKNINKLIHYYYKHKLTVIFTKHINTHADAGLMDKWWKELLTEENPLCDITNEMDISKGVIINKTQYNAFYKTELKKILIENNIKQIVITGVMTHLCCETTARSGFINGYEVFFTIDGTASYNSEYHKASLLNLAHGFAVPVLVEDLLRR